LYINTLPEVENICNTVQIQIDLIFSSTGSGERSITYHLSTAGKKPIIINRSNKIPRKKASHFFILTVLIKGLFQAPVIRQVGRGSSHRLQP